MIPGVVLFALALVWLSGVAYVLGHPVVSYVLGAWGAGWLGILYGYLILRRCVPENGEPDVDQSTGTGGTGGRTDDEKPSMFSRYPH